MRALVTFYEGAKAIIEDTRGTENAVTWKAIRIRFGGKAEGWFVETDISDEQANAWHTAKKSSSFVTKTKSENFRKRKILLYLVKLSKTLGLNMSECASSVRSAPIISTKYVYDKFHVVPFWFFG